MRVNEIKFIEEDSLLKIDLNKSIIPNEEYVIEISFKGTIPETLRFAASDQVKHEKTSDGYKHFTVETGPVRDFYLLGSENWDKVSKVYKGIRMTSWYPKGRMQQGIDAL